MRNAGNASNAPSAPAISPAAGSASQKLTPFNVRMLVVYAPTA